MNIRFLAALPIAAALLVSPARADKLKFGNEGIYPPFSNVESNGELSGFEPELAREMCKRMHADCEFIVMDFKALIPSLLQNKFNGVISQMNPLPERREKALFTIPIVVNPSTFVAAKDSHFDFTRGGLKGLKIGMPRGSADAKWVLANFDGVEPVWYDNPDQIRLDLLAKRIDMAFGAQLNWTMELIQKPEGNDWKLAGGAHWVGDDSLPEDQRGLSWIVGKNEKPLAERMNVALKSMMEDCTFTAIRKKFLPVPVLPADEACVAKGS